jgi:hypothetical protein
MHRRCKINVVLLALAFSSLAHAEPQEVRASLEVRAPDSCGAPRLLLARVERRSARIRFVEPGAGARRVRAEVREVVPRDYRATLSLWSEDGRELVRELRAADCAEAYDALALVIAVTLDPDADLGAEPEENPSEKPTEERGESGAAAEPRTGAGVAKAEPQPSSRPASEAPAIVERRAEVGDLTPSADGSVSALTPSFGLLAAMRSGPAPMVLPGFGMFVGLEGLPGFPERSLVRVSALRHRRGNFEAAGGVADFSLDTLRLDACPFGFGRAGLRAYLCLEAEYGRLEAEGSVTVDGQRRSRPWRSLGAGALVAYSPLPVLELGLLGALEHPLVRDTFQFEPEAFHEVGPVGARLELALGLRLP